MSQHPRIRVLLVEDSPDDARLIHVLLGKTTEASFVITHEDRLGKGVARLKQDRFDVVLLDFSLPDSFGLDTFLSIHEADPRVPVIVLTSLDDDELAARAVREGAQDYLVKREVDTRLLVRSIRYAIARQTADDALRDSEERYALAVQGANDGVFDWDLRSDTVYFSPRWKKMLGYSEFEVGPSTHEWFERIHPDDEAAFRRKLTAHLDGETEHFRLEHRIKSAGGRWLWVLTRGLAVRGADGRPSRMAGSQSDITARKVAEEKLQHDALHDDLTCLANRVLFMDRLSCSMADFERTPENQFAVLFFDLDRFKNVNDSLGHPLGDKLLKGIAQRLEHYLRPGDTVARIGGDEFAILLNRINDIPGAIHVAERIQELLGMTFSIDGHEVFVTASIGIAHSATGYRTPDEIMRDADIAMYRAKAAGKARYEVFDRNMHQSAVALLKLETELRLAVQNNDFVMHYQPIVDLKSGHIVGFEALVRWIHTERGIVSPNSFIAIAEETGLIVPLGWWVLEESCRQARQWQDRFPIDPALFISVNVSGKLFLKRGIVDRLMGILEATGLPPESLRLEVTENVVLEHVNTALDNLQLLRALGIQLSIDDFGTGYSSLSYLQRFHYDELKIDRSFVSRLGQGTDSRAIVETILGLASNLGIGVVAEGVETAEQADRLRQMACPHGQGFWFSRPVSAVDAGNLIAAGPEWFTGEGGLPA